MDTTKQKTLMLHIYSKSIFVIVLIALLFACKKDIEEQDIETPPTEEENPEPNDPEPKKMVLVYTSVSGDVFDNSENSHDKVTTLTRQSNAGSGIQKERITLSDQLSIHAELAPLHASDQAINGEAVYANFNSLVQPTKASMIKGNDNLAKNIKYKVAVFDESGKYLLQRDYVKGKENEGDSISLESNSKYTFIAFSVNRADALPALQFSDYSNKTIETAQLDAIEGTATDVLYFRKDVDLTEDATQKLTIKFNHIFSQIIATINSAKTGYPITAIKCMFNSYCKTALVRLATGDIVRKPAVSAVDVNFPLINKNEITSAPLVINTDKNGSAVLKLTNITIGGLPINNTVAFEKFKIKNGVNYLLKIELDPSDMFLTHQGYPAVRINGKIWMQHNLGADSKVALPQSPQTSAVHGSFYQWGRNVAFSNGKSDLTESNWSANFNRASNSWNTGTEEKPLKSSEDPCPNGYRVPTQTELQHLLDNTIIASNTGEFSNSTGNYSASKVLVSKRNINVKVYFPIQGDYSYFPYSDGITPRSMATKVTNRGNLSYLWTSSYSDTNPISSLALLKDKVSWTSKNDSRKEFRCRGFNIRCIAQ